MKNKYLILSILIVAILAVGAFVFYQKKPVAVNPAPAPVADTSTGGQSFTRAQVKEHNSRASCYTVIADSVYDLTAWISGHPGGEEAILSLCGGDGTAAFTAQHGGQKRPETMLAKFKIGSVQ